MSEKDEITEVNAQGGMGSSVPWFELVDARALRAIAEVFAYGARRYKRDNWRAVSVDEHLRHAIAHAYQVLEPGQQYQVLTTISQAEVREELEHFACRALMALAVHLQDSHVLDVVPKGKV